MNRIVLIGNGFDLAHGMKTSYNDFLDYLWKEVLGKAYQNGVAGYQNELVSVSNFHGFWEDIDSNESAKRKVNRHFSTIHYKNKFFEKIVERQYIDSWVDIEKEFYKRLTECYKIDLQQKTDASKKQIDQLNTDFQQIKRKLQQYLVNEELAFNDILKKGELNFDQIARSIGSKMYKNIELRECSEDYKDEKVAVKYEELKPSHFSSKIGLDIPSLHSQILNRLDDNLNKKDLRKLMVDNESPMLFINMPDQVLRLSFNYTLTEELYFDSTKFISSDRMHPIVIDPIHIHGSIHEEDKNPIIFGYGDELDDDYLDIEKLDDNRYLENIKSVKYLDRDNYKRLLEFVNSDQYQVVIMGHSCGNSDRTLLNTLFEHDNCVSIKPYYHQKEDGSDNYSDIVRNITRNFNDKQKLRDRVVNKTFCEPLL